MSTKNVTTQQQGLLFNPASMKLFGDLTSTAGGALSSEIANPYNSMLFNTQVGKANQALSAQNSSAMASSLERANALGMNKNSPLINWNIRMNDLAGKSRGADMLNNLLLQAAQLRQGAIGEGLNYRPLSTGSTGTTTQQQKGLGTWLPQVLSMAMPFASPLIGGMLGGVMKNMHGNFSGNFQAPSGFGGGYGSPAPGPAPDIGPAPMGNPFLQLGNS